MSTKAQQTYERVNALVDGGTTKAEAFKQLAEEYGQPVDSVRGAYYGRTSARRLRKRETTAEDAVASAVATLHGAIDSIMAEVAAAQERAVEAAAECKAMQDTASGKIEAIQAKIAALTGEPPVASAPARKGGAGS